MRGLFVTGTDTDVGKTYVSAIILKELISAGVQVGVTKPACSGAVDDGDQVRWPDLEQLSSAAAVPDIDRICSQRFHAPLAPPVAAKHEGRHVSLRVMQDELLAWESHAEIVVVEGVGGLLCPLTDEESIADFAQWVGFPLIIVARLGLGTINHTLLTIEAARQRNLDLAGIVLNDAANLAATPAGQTNAEELTARTTVPILGIVRSEGQSVCLRDGMTPGRIAWSKLALSRRL